MDDEQPYSADYQHSSRFLDDDPPWIYGQPAVSYEDFVSDFMGTLFGALWHLGVELQDECLGFSATLGGPTFEALWNGDEDDDSACDRDECYSCEAGVWSRETSSSVRMDNLHAVELLSPGPYQLCENSADLSALAFMFSASRQPILFHVLVGVHLTTMTDVLPAAPLRLMS